MIEPGEIEEIAAGGGVGEMLGHFFDADGRVIDTTLTARTLAAALAGQPRGRMVAIAGGARRSRDPRDPSQRAPDRAHHRRTDGDENPSGRSALVSPTRLGTRASLGRGWRKRWDFDLMDGLHRRRFSSSFKA